MRVSTNVLAFLGAASLAAASPMPAADIDFVGPVTGGVVSASTDVAARSEDSEVLQKRAIVATIITAAGTAAASAAAEAAVNAAVKLIGQISNWDQAREEFTKKTVSEMAARNPNRNKYVATICYNMSYDLQYPSGMDGKVSVSFRSGPLHTNYDCFYMTRPNSLWTRGDGGFVNLAISHDNRCSFDSRTADLYCA